MKTLLQTRRLKSHFKLTNGKRLLRLLKVYFKISLNSQHIEEAVVYPV